MSSLYKFHRISDLATFFFVISVLSAIFFFVDPTQRYFGFSEYKMVKYLPVEVGFLAAGLYAIDRVLPSRELLILLLFGIWVLVGGLYTIIVNDQPLMESFVGRGLTMFLVYPAYCMAVSDRYLRSFAKLIFPFLVAGAFVVFSGIFIWALGVHFIHAPHVYHAQVILPVSVGLVLLVFMKKRHPLLAHFLGFLLISSGILLYKNTGFIVVLTALLLLLAMSWHHAKSREMLLLKRVIMVAFLVLVASIFVLIVIQLDWTNIYSHLPSGSPEVRIKTYSKRLDMFAESPFIGTMFVGTPIEVLPTRYGKLVIPSHSDLLDVLAFGGLLGCGMFLIPLLYTLKANFSYLKNIGKFPFSRIFLWSYAYCPMGLFVLTVNPIWNQPEVFTLLMLAVGILIAFAQRKKRRKAVC